MRDLTKIAAVAGIVGVIALGLHDSSVIQDTAPFSLQGEYIGEEFEVQGNEGKIDIVALIEPEDAVEEGKSLFIQIQVLREGEWRDWGGCEWHSGNVETPLESVPQPNCGVAASDLEGQTVRAVFRSDDITTGIKIETQ